MKRLMILADLLASLGVATSPTFAGMDGPRVPPKSTEGPNVRAKVEPKGVECPDAHHTGILSVQGTEGPGGR